MNNVVIYGYGEWTGTYFSQEIKNCEKYGYEFEILGGYIFESRKLFKDYIETMNEIKVSNPKNSPMYLIGKMLMNHLFGRFALDPWLPECVFMKKN